jgi:hypothetical protein
VTHAPDEQSLRQWALDRLQADGNTLMWIGSDADRAGGTPDLVLVTGRRTVFLQLSMASWRRVGSFLVCPAIAVRHPQKRWHREAAYAGLLSGFMVGLAPPPQLTPPDAVACFTRPDGRAATLWNSGRMSVAMLSSAQYRRWAISGSLPSFAVVDSWPDVRSVIGQWIADVELAA